MKALTLFLLLAISSFAKSAEDYLHDAAYKYIAERTQEAAVAVDEGLREYPDDPKLQNLKDLLKQMKDQQRQDQNQSGGGDSKKNQDSKDQKNKDDQNKDGQNKDRKKDQQDQKDKQDKGQNPKDSSGQDKDKPQPKPDEKNGQPPKDSSGQGGQARRMPGQMSKDEAERLLNSYVDEEKKAQQDRQGTPKKRVEPGQQDW